MGETKLINVQTGRGDAAGLAGSVLPSSSQARLDNTTVVNVTPDSSNESSKASKLLFRGAGLRAAWRKQI